MPDNHADLASEQMLYGKRVSALAMAAYFLRNDGFVLSGDPSADDLVAAFRLKFDYPEGEADSEFEQLFTTDAPANVAFQWFEPATSLTDSPEAPAEEASDA